MNRLSYKQMHKGTAEQKNGRPIFEWGIQLKLPQFALTPILELFSRQTNEWKLCGDNYLEKRPKVRPLYSVFCIPTVPPYPVFGKIRVFEHHTTNTQLHTTFIIQFLHRAVCGNIGHWILMRVATKGTGSAAYGIINSNHFNFGIQSF